MPCPSRSGRPPELPSCSPTIPRPGLNLWAPVLLSGWLVSILGCGGNPPAPTPPPAVPTAVPPTPPPASGDKQSAKPRPKPAEKVLQTEARFLEVAEQAGVQFAYRDGQEANKFAILESLGGGVGLADFDNDGQNDLYFTGGGRFTEEDQPVGHPGALFRNRGKWRFVNATEVAGLNSPRHYNHGAAVADYDNDGFADLLVTGFGGVQLFHNQGDGTFVEQAEPAGLTDRLWSSSAGWGDFNNDGILDLLVAHYVNWSPENDPQCPGPTQNEPREVCSPRRFNGLPDSLYLGLGDGQFRDISDESGLRRPGTDDDGQDKGLGVVLADIDLDGDLDAYIGNDTVPNFLYINREGRLTEVGIRSGTALSDRGTPDGSMGVDIVDFNLDGRPDIWVANYERESLALYRQEKGGGQGDVFFTHVSQMTGVTNVGGLFVGWGTAFLDFDCDGDEDALVSNGHVIRFPSNSEIAQVPLLLENLAGKRFQNVAPISGEYLAGKHRGRGLAVGDLDGDGRVDVAISHINDPVALLQNQSRQQPHWLRLKLHGRRSNRTGIGAHVRLTAGGKSQMHLVKGGGSYASTSDHALHFGLGDQTVAETIEIHWPSGLVQTLSRVDGDQTVAVLEPLD